MGKVTGFLEVDRRDRTYEPASDRVRNFGEFLIPLERREVVSQASRCMDCGIPYCHNGCPVNNQIPDWNDLVYHEDWEEAARNLHSTNNFPEFTGRVCPAPCEESCTLNLEDVPVTIKSIECAIVDRAFEEGWVKPEIAGEKDRQARRRRRLRSGGPCRRPAAGPRRPRGPCLRKGGASRRVAALRHPQFQARQEARRTPHRPDGGRRRPLPLQDPCRQGRHGRRTGRPV